jgi:CheY-like chemotaxis protein
MSTHPQATRLLIVDDDPSTIRFLSHRFAQLGFEVETASDGLAALLMAGRRVPDVLITDVRMPKVDGPALARALARNGGRMLTIVISAYDDPRIRAFCREVNAAYAKKGPKLWADIAMALAAAFPAVAARAVAPEAVRPPANRFSRHRATPD